MTAREHYDQARVVAWAGALAGRVPELWMLYAIPNAARRSARQGAWMKAEGLRRGVPDLCLAVPSQGYHGLYIEMKAEGGRLTQDQKDWLAQLAQHGYKAVRCVGADEAILTIAQYLGKPELVIGR